MKFASKLFGSFQRIVHAHRGKMRVEAEPDDGACFYCSIRAEQMGPQHDEQLGGSSSEHVEMA